MYKPVRIREGKKITSKRYVAKYPDENGCWKSVTLFTDKTASETKLNQLKREAELRRVGVITPVMDHAARPILAHVEDYISDLRQQQRVREHVRNVRTRLTEIITTGGWSRLSNITADGMASVLTTLSRRRVTRSRDKNLPLAVTTVNSFLKVMRAFVAWLLKRDRLLHDPLKSLDYATEARAEPRRARRALTVEEIRKLLSAAPPHRALIYKTLLLTGLRRKEARYLLVGDLHLDGPHPFIQLRAKETKNARPDPIPLHPDLIDPLRNLTHGRPAGQRVFRAIPEVRTLERDLKKAGIPFVDELGRRVDLHATRHTYSTLLVLSGARPGEAQRLMRHSNPALTMQVYSHLGLDATREALSKVQLPPLPEAEVGTGTVTENVAKTSASRGLAASTPGDCKEAELEVETAAATAGFTMKYGRIVLSGRDAATLGLLLRPSVDTVEKQRPRSSVG